MSLQLGILVLDASGSMAEPVKDETPGTTKAWQIEKMIAKPFPKDPRSTDDRREVLKKGGFIAKLSTSRTADFTDLAIFRYDQNCELYQEVRPLKKWELMPFTEAELDPKSGTHYTLCGQQFNLLDGKSGGTDIAEGLRQAHECAKQWLDHIRKTNPSDANNAFVTILLMSDLMVDDGGEREALRMAAEIKTNVEIAGRPQILLAAAAFGDNANITLMNQLAHSTVDKQTGQPVPCAIKSSNPDDLREFFLKSMARE